MIYKALSAVAASYLLGGFLGGAITSKIKGIDLRRHGSGNMGATNVLRTLGPVYALATLAIDVAKGAAAVVLGRWAAVPGLDAFCGLAAIAGHNWPGAARFRGGKGIATTCGVLALLAPKSLLILLPVWTILALPTGFISLGSVVAAAAILPVIYLLYRGQPGLEYLLCFGAIGAAMAIYQHRDNIGRLFRGTERNIWRPGK